MIKRKQYGVSLKHLFFNPRVWRQSKNGEENRWSSPVGVNCSLSGLSQGSTSPLGVNFPRGQLHLWGPTSPLGANFSPRVQLLPWGPYLNIGPDLVYQTFRTKATSFASRWVRPPRLPSSRWRPAQHPLLRGVDGRSLQRRPGTYPTKKSYKYMFVPITFL
jgi:hypothetical protein